MHLFHFINNCHLPNVQTFLNNTPNPDELSTVSDKLKWYHYKNGLLQSEVAKIMSIARTTYSRYEQTILESYPLDKLTKVAEYFKIDVTDLLDEYNLFLYKGQGEKIKRLRKSLKLTQSELAQNIAVSLGTFKKWEQNKVRITKASYLKLIEILNNIY